MLGWALRAGTGMAINLSGHPTMSVTQCYLAMNDTHVTRVVYTCASFPCDWTYCLCLDPHCLRLFLWGYTGAGRKISWGRGNGKKHRNIPRKRRVEHTQRHSAGADLCWLLGEQFAIFTHLYLYFNFEAMKQTLFHRKMEQNGTIFGQYKPIFPIT